MVYYGFGGTDSADHRTEKGSHKDPNKLDPREIKLSGHLVELSELSHHCKSSYCANKDSEERTCHDKNEGFIRIEKNDAESCKAQGS